MGTFLNKHEERFFSKVSYPLLDLVSIFVILTAGTHRLTFRISFLKGVLKSVKEQLNTTTSKHAQTGRNISIGWKPTYIVK